MNTWTLTRKPGNFRRALPLRPLGAKNGSALLITLLVTSLLVMMVLAFVVVVRMEIRNITQFQAQQVARANARLGAELAISRLQMLAGPDQRVTLPAWAEENLALNPGSPVLLENRNWTGVRNSEEWRRDSEGVPRLNPDFGRHLGWLISGGQTVSPRTYFPFTLTPEGQIELTAGNALLVGPGSVSAAQDRNENGIPDGFVAAPLLPVAAGNATAQGHFAYWVSDEATKARLNLADRHRETEQRAWSLGIAQRAGPEWMVPGLNPENPAHREWTSRVHSDSQWSLLAEALNPGVGNRDFFHDVTSTSMGLPVSARRGGLKRDLTAVAESAVQSTGGRVLHSLPAYQELIAFNRQRQEDRLQESLLLQGMGQHAEALRRALPLRQSQISGSLHNVGQFPDMHKIFPPSTFSAHQGEAVDPGGPQWRQLLEYMTLGEHRGRTDAQGFVMDAANHTSQQYGLGVSPIRIHFRYRFSLDTRGNQYLLRFHVMPAIAMWNPHNVRVSVPEVYMASLLGLNQLNGVPIYFRVRHPAYHESGESYWMPPHQFFLRNPRNSLARDSQGADPSDSQYAFLFRLPARVYEPGETVWFELGQHHRMEFIQPGVEGATHGSGYSLLPWPFHGNVPVFDANRQPGTAFMGNPRWPQSYLPLVEGLENDGGFSLYFEENLTHRTKTWAGGWIAPYSTDPNSLPEPTDPIQTWNRLVSFQSDFHEGGHVNTPRISRHWPTYPAAGFEYRLYNDPDTPRTHSFALAGTNAAGQPFALQRYEDVRFPAQMNIHNRPDRVNSAYGRGDWISANGRTSSDQRINPWFERRQFPDTHEFWRNKKWFPLTYNEHGIIYASPPRPGAGYAQQDFIPDASIAVDRSGITTDWRILEARVGVAGDITQHGLRRGMHMGNEWLGIRDPGRGIIAFDVNPTDHGNVYSGRIRAVISGFEPQLPTSLMGDPLAGESNASPANLSGQPRFVGRIEGGVTSALSFNPSRPFTSADSQALSFGWMLALRQPDHGLVGDPQTMVKVPWLSHYNPATTWLGPDIFSVRPMRRGGVGTSPVWIGGMSLDPDLLDPTQYTLYSGNRQEVMIGHSARLGGGRSVLLEVPRSLEDIGSLGQLMHAQLHSYGGGRILNGIPQDTEYIRHFHNNHTTHLAADLHPLYAIGGSMANPLIPSTDTFRNIFTEHASLESGGGFPSRFPGEWANRFTSGLNSWQFFVQNTNTAYHQIPVYDVSFFLNHALWDDFMVTGLANGRLLWQNGTPERDFHLSASRLLIDGAFNVNSTSVAAWAALLGSFYGMEVDLPNSTSDFFAPEDRVPFTRLTRPQGRAFSPGQGADYNSPEMFSGYRRLSAQEIWDRDNNTGLAVEIVNVIRERGPFLNLADFVNRNPASPDLIHRKMGPLQQAIQQSGINGNGIVYDTAESSTLVRAGDWNLNHLRSDGTPFLMGRHVENIIGIPASLGAPGSVMQQDILSKIGGIIQVRSDTFKIRAYGSAGTDSTSPSARAWCEVIVQRLPDYVVSNTGNDLLDNTPEQMPAELSPLNHFFGRRFEIIGFRWLTEDEI